MLIRMRHMFTDTVFNVVKFKYKTSIDDWGKADRISVQKYGMAFYFNHYHFTRCYIYDYSDNCDTMNKIMKKMFDK